MKTSKVLQTIDVMTESVVKELNEMSEKIENKASRSAVQTIAKHLINLESRVMDLEKEKKYVCHKLQNYGISVVVFDEFSELTKDQVEYIKSKAKPQTDYFLKAKNLLIEYAEKTMIKKGMEYTPVGDRFANFRPILGEKKTAIEKLIGYNAKHVQYCYMQNENPSYPSDTYKRENTAIGYIFGYGENRKEFIKESLFRLAYDKWVSLRPKVNELGEPIEYYTARQYLHNCAEKGILTWKSGNVTENKEYYKQCYIDELLEHWGDVFNYNVLGLAMENTDRSKAFVVPYADRPTQEKEIKNIVDSVKDKKTINFTDGFENKRYGCLLNTIDRNNLFDIIYLFAKQLERLENSK